MSKKKKGNSKKAQGVSSGSSSKSKNAKASRSKIITLGLLLALFGFLIYSNTLSHEYTLDDYSAIKENFVTKKGVAGLGDIFTKHYRYGYWNSNGTLYRPISLAMFAVEWSIMEDSPGFYHFVNVLLYAFTGFFLFWTLVKLLPEILSFLFCMGAIYGLWKYLRFKDVKWMIMAVLSYTIAMFSKESAITFLAVFPMIGYFFLKKLQEKGRSCQLLFYLPENI